MLDAAAVVADLQPGAVSSSPAEMTPFHGAIYFSASGTTSSGANVGRELFRLNADGSVQLVANINTASGGAASSDPANFVVFDGKLVFAATGPQGRELYQLTTTGQVSLLSDVRTGTLGSDPQVLTVFNDKLYFSASAGSGRELYVLNRGGNVSLIADINPGAASSNPSELFLFRDNLYFAATGPSGRILYRQSPSGTSDPQPIALPNGATDPLDFVEFDGKMYFSADDPADGRELFVLTVSANNNTITVSKFANLNGTSADSSPSEFTVLGDYLYFAASGTNGREPFRLSKSGTITSLNLATGSSSSSPSEFVVFNNRLYFAATVGGARGLWVVGSDAATFTASAVPLPAGVSLPDLANFRVAGSELYFSASGSQGRELYRLSTGGVVSLASDINGGSASSDPAETFRFGDQVYVVATQSGVGRELFVLHNSPSVVRIDDDTLLFTDNSGLDNFVVVSSDGARLTLRDENGNTISVQGSIAGVVGNGTSQIIIPLASLSGVDELQFDTGGGDDVVVFELSQFAASFLTRFDAVTYNGGSQNDSQTGDKLRFVGDGVTTSLYSPSSSQTGRGTVTIARGQLSTQFTFDDLEPVDFTGMAEAILQTGNGNDNLTLSAGFDSIFGAASAIVATGTRSGTTIERAHFFGNALVTIRTLDGEDTITVQSTGTAHGNGNLTLDTGEFDWDDDVILAAAFVAGSLSVHSTFVTVNGQIQSGGSTSLNAMRDINFASSATLLASGVILRGDSNVLVAGGVYLAAGSLVDAGAGTILIESADDVRLGRIVTQNASSQAVHVTSRLGSIVASGSGANVEISAAAAGAVVTLDSAGSIGTSSNALDVATGNLVTESVLDQYLVAHAPLVSLNLVAPQRTITLTALASVNDSDAALDVQAQRWNLTAATAGTALAPLHTALQFLSATATAGDVYVRDSDGLEVTSVNASGNAGISSVAGSLQVRSLIAGNRATLQAAGAVTGVGAAPHVRSAALEVAARSVNLTTQVTNFRAQATNGSVTLVNQGDLTVGNIPGGLLPLVGVNATASAIQLTAQGSLHVFEAIATTGTGTIALSAATDLSVQAALSTQQGNQTLTAGRDVIVGSNATSQSGNIALTATRSLRMTPGAKLTTTSGGLTLLANQGTTPASGDFRGILLDGAILQTNSGSITLAGRSGDAGVNQAGIELRGGTSLQTVSGAVNLVGVSRGTGAGSSGILLDGATVDASGTGSVLATGSASTAAGASGAGIELRQASQLGATGTGDVTLAGTGSGGVADITWDSLTIGKTGGVYTFQDTVAGGSLQVLPGNYSVRFLDGGSISTAVTFQNAGNLILGNQNSDVMTFAGGVTHIAGPTTVQGTLATSAAPLVLGTTTLVSAVTLRTHDGAITLGAVSAAGVPLTIEAGSGAVSLSQATNVIGHLTITAGSLVLTEADAITQAGAWTVPGAVTLNAGANAIVLSNAGNVLGDLTITAGSLVLTEADAITQSGAWTIPGTVTLSSGPNAILLGNPGNVLGDLTITAGSLILAETDAITQGGAWTIPGAVTLNAGANAIVLSNASNSLGDLTITAGALTLTEADAITQAGAWTIPGPVTLNAGASGIVLANTNNVLGDLTITAGSLVLMEADAITQGGAWTIPGTVQLNSGTHAIILNAAGNVLGDLTITAGSLVLREADAITQAGAWTIPGPVTLNAAANLINLANANNLLGNLTITAGSLVLTEADAITQAGAWTISGPVTLDAGFHAVVLNNSNNLLGNLTITAASLVLTEADAITQSGAWTIPGPVTLNAAAHDILLSQPGNILGPLTVQGGTVVIHDSGDLEVSALSFQAALELSAEGDLIAGGTIAGTGQAVLAARGNITFANNASLTSQGAALAADADQNGAGGIALATGSTITAGSGTLLLEAAGDILLSEVGTDNATAAAVRVTSRLGQILASGSGSGLEISAPAPGATITLESHGNIGSSPRALDLATGRLATQSSSGDQFLAVHSSLAALDLQALNRTITLSVAGSVQDADNAVDIAAQSLILTATAAGSSAAPLQTSLAAVTAQATAGDLHFAESDDLTLVQLTASGSVSVSSLGGGLQVGAITAGNLVTLAAQESVTGNGAGPHVTSSAVEIAALGANLVTQTGTLEALVGSGGLAMHNLGDLTAGNIAGSLLALTGISAAGQVQVTVQGTLTVVETIATTGAAPLMLQAAGDLFVNAPLTTQAGAQLLAAGRDIVLALGNSISTASGVMHLRPDSDQSGNGSLSVFGDIDVGAGHARLEVRDSQSFVSGTISGSGGIAKAGSGTLTLVAGSAQTYTGETDIEQGTLRVDGALGSSTSPAARVLISGGATLTGDGDLWAPVHSTATTARIVSGGALKLGDGSLQGLQFSGEMIVQAGHVITIRDADLAELGIATIIASGGQLVAQNGVEVGSGDKLSGSGAVAGNIVVRAGGFVSPGTSPGIVTTNIGDVQLFPGAIYLVDIFGLAPGSQYDQLNVTGSVMVGNSILGLTGGNFQPGDGTVFTLINNDGEDPIQGRFLDAGGNVLGEGARVTFGGIEANISYFGGAGGNDVILTVTGFRFIRTTTDTPLTTLVMVAQGGGGGGATLRERVTEAPLILNDTVPTVTFSESFEPRNTSLEVRAAERLRVYIRVVNEATGVEEPREYDLDPNVLRDVLVVFKRYKFQNGRYRVYLQEPGKRERLVIDVNIMDGRVVPADLQGEEAKDPAPDQPQDAPTDDNKTAAPGAPDNPNPAAVPKDQSSRAEESSPEPSRGAALPLLLASLAPWRRRAKSSAPPEIPQNRHALRLRRLRPR